ncbi:hypothetical protein U3516DRAFT_802211 [Neocallimastix sp. 'constans']
MPEIDQTNSTSYNSFLYKNKNITKINNYEYRILNLNDLKNKNKYKYERSNHFSNSMTKKKDKKLNQVLQPGGEGMQYLINTLKKYQMMQQKQQQWNKQRSKFYNLTSKVFDDDESSDNSFDNIYNKYNGLPIINPNNNSQNKFSIVTQSQISFKKKIDSDKKQQQFEDQLQNNQDKV